MDPTTDATADREALPHQLPGLKRPYSLRRALARALEREGRPDGLEGEVSAEIARRSGGHPKGFYMPFDAPLGERRALDTTAGTGAIPTRLPRTWIDALRARSVLATLGATILDLPGLGRSTGKIQLPRKTAATSVFWVGEGGAPRGATRPSTACRWPRTPRATSST